MVFSLSSFLLHLPASWIVLSPRPPLTNSSYSSSLQCLSLLCATLCQVHSPLQLWLFFSHKNCSIIQFLHRKWDQPVRSLELEETKRWKRLWMFSSSTIVSIPFPYMLFVYLYQGNDISLYNLPTTHCTPNFASSSPELGRFLTGYLGSTPCLCLSKFLLENLKGSASELEV
jgi:hypothetical protein